MARIIFMGTPDYARRILEKIWNAQDDWLIVTKPDMPVGRHRQMTPSSVGSWALGHGVELMRPHRLKDAREAWAAFLPDWILTAAFGRILPEWALNLPRFGAYNLHASLLPRWRGPNPIAWAIRANDPETGVTLMRMDSGIDTGPIIAQAKVPIESVDTTPQLTDKLADVAAALWMDAAGRRRLMRFPERPQGEAGVSYAPKFESDAGHLDWSEAADVLDAWVRSMTPEPGAYTTWHEQRIKVLEAKVDAVALAGPPGRAVLKGNEWRVAAGRGALSIARIQPAGRRPMTPGDFVRGRRGESEWQLR